MTTTSVAPTSSAARPLNVSRLGIGILAALVVNFAVYAIASGADATWSANGQTVSAVLVPIATVAAMFIGGVITWLLARRWSKATVTMAWVGLVFAIVSAPSPILASDDAPTRWALASMHVITGIVWFFAVLPSRSSRAG